MKLQEYICEECGVESHIYYEEHEDFMSVLHKIEDDHQHWSPECTIPVIKLYVEDNHENKKD